jgi:hypothetical protein
LIGKFRKAILNINILMKREFFFDWFMIYIESMEDFDLRFNKIN